MTSKHFKPWHEIAEPHEDVLKGTFQQAEFAADLSRVDEGIDQELQVVQALIHEKRP